MRVQSLSTLSPKTGVSLAELGELFCAARVPGDRLAERRAQRVDAGNPYEECGCGGWQVVDQRLHEMPVHVAGTHRKRRDRLTQVGAAFDRRDQQLQSERPAFGQLMQPHAGVEIDA